MDVKPTGGLHGPSTGAQQKMLRTTPDYSQWFRPDTAYAEE